MSIWRFREHRRLARRLRTLPVRVRDSYETWKNVLRAAGPEALRELPGTRDEVLRGQWKGYRSSRLSSRYRVIYRVVRDNLVIEVIDVNPHDYRRK